MTDLFAHAASSLVLVKIGSALLIDGPGGAVRQHWLDGMCADFAELAREGHRLVIVSSGAIALGRSALGLRSGALRLEESQAAAAVGQVKLAQAWADALARQNLVAAQVLLTLDDTEERRRYLNARATLSTLLELGAVAVINENDTVATAEIRYGDNDRLAARVASMMGADVLILFSDVDGLYNANPHRDPDARYIDVVAEITPEIEAMAAGSVSGLGRGGMASKIAAARIATAAGCQVVIARGQDHALAKLRDGARHTRFLATTTPSAARKRWIAGSLKPQGTLHIDAGALSALLAGKSLLPAGVRGVEGDFARGDAVRILGPDGREAGRGLSAYGAEDARAILGRRTDEIPAILGYRGRDAMVHRDDLALSPKGFDMNLDAEMLAMGRRAREAAGELREASAQVRCRALEAAAQSLGDQRNKILAANASDLAAAQAAGLPAPVIDRLRLDSGRLDAMARGVAAIARQADPVGQILAEWPRPNGLTITRMTTPIGVIGVIYESRPNVTADAAALCLKSANAAILRCGSEARESARAIHAAFVAGVTTTALPSASAQLVTMPSRDAVGLMLQGLGGNLDLLVPRGGKSLTARVVADARVPVLAHLEGLVHIYLHEGADLAKACALVHNAKMRRTGICGAAETLLIDRSVLSTLGATVLGELVASGCQIRGDEEVCQLIAAAVPASEDDWRTEYLDAIIAVRCVDGLKDAIAHIEHYGSQHTDCIVTEDALVAEEFLRKVDSAIVMWNASTQFADGGEFGMGAEIGIATGRLHARGPVGAEQLVTFKYVVRGDGQCRD